MHAARMIDLLDLEIGLTGLCGEDDVTPIGLFGRGARRQAQSLAPELARGLQVVRLAIDDEAAQLASMHGLLQTRTQRMKRSVPYGRGSCETAPLSRRLTE